MRFDVEGVSAGTCGGRLFLKSLLSEDRSKRFESCHMSPSPRQSHPEIVTKCNIPFKQPEMFLLVDICCLATVGGWKGVGDKHRLTRPLSAIFLPSVTDVEPTRSSAVPSPGIKAATNPPTVDRRCNQSNNGNDWAALWLSHWQSPALYPGYLKDPPTPPHPPCCNLISSFHGHFELEGYHSSGIYKPLSFSLTPFDQSNAFFFIVLYIAADETKLKIYLQTTYRSIELKKNKH